MSRVSRSSDGRNNDAAAARRGTPRLARQKVKTNAITVSCGPRTAAYPRVRAHPLRVGVITCSRPRPGRGLVSRTPPGHIAVSPSLSNVRFWFSSVDVMSPDVFDVFDRGARADLRSRVSFTARCGATPDLRYIDGGGHERTVWRRESRLSAHTWYRHF